MKDADKKLLDGYMADLKQEAVWIGEDGGACCVATTKLGALRKFRRLMRQDVGESEALEMKIEDIGIGFLHLPEDRNADEAGCDCDCHKPNEKGDHDDKTWKHGCEVCKSSHSPDDEYMWYVSLKPSQDNEYQVFVFNT